MGFQRDFSSVRVPTFWRCRTWKIIRAMRKGAHGAAGCNVSFALGLRVENCCSVGDSCGRTPFPGSHSAGDGHLVAPGRAGRAEGSSPRARAQLGRGGAGAHVATLAPCHPQPSHSMSPHSPTHQHRWPPACQAVLATEGGSRQTDRQTNRHVQDTQALLQNCLQFAAPAQRAHGPCPPDPSLPSAGAARRGRGFTEGEAPGGQLVPARGGRDGRRSPGRVGGKGTGWRLCSSGVLGAGGQPGAPVLPVNSKGCRFSRWLLLRRLLTHATPHARASATGTFMLRRSSRWVIPSWDLGRRKEVMLELA